MVEYTYDARGSPKRSMSFGGSRDRGSPKRNMSFGGSRARGNHVFEGNTRIATINPYRYRGYYYDTEIGLYFLKTRYYDPVSLKVTKTNSL